MQSKGAIRLVTIALLIACVWQLSFTAVTAIQENKAAQKGAEVAEAAKATAAYQNVGKDFQIAYVDSVKTTVAKRYLDSLSTQKVYFGYEFKDVQAKQLNLGLDLKGGMNVMLQVQLEDLIKALAGENQNKPEFQQALEAAKAESVTSTQGLIALFAKNWATITDSKPLATVFGTLGTQGKITAKTSDSEVVTYLEGEAKSAVDNSFNVMRNRIDRFGVTQPSIQTVGNTGRILIELPGVKEPERVRKLLQGTASLEFWPTMSNAEAFEDLRAANDYLAKTLDTFQGDSARVAAVGPLFALLQVVQPTAGFDACIGYAAPADMDKIDEYLALASEEFKDGFTPMWSAKPTDRRTGEVLYELVAIDKSSSTDGNAIIDGSDVSDARVTYNNAQGGYPSVSMTMKHDGAIKWAKMTRDNVNKQIAIVLDGSVYSYPLVHGEIAGGNSEISGRFDLEEATDLTNVLKSGKLPAPATIIQEQVVGPTLGAESINAGLISFLIAFVLVLIYMVFFYQGAGLAADAALLANVVLLFGTLASFGAVLTLPGIAGLVLTLGMAVDANVIIYERIKEELAAGKGLSKAVADGYSNAYSAIIDGQVTTLLTGLVLFFFGTGPVKGFATTLVIGIITSVFTSIFITRLIFERRIAKGKNITFENKLTKNFLKNTHVDFIGKRKYSYIISGCLILIAIVSMFAKGFTEGVDFTGGRSYVVKFENVVNSDDVRKATIDVFSAQGASVEVKQFGGPDQMKITTSYKYDEENTAVDAEIEGMLYQALKGFYKEGYSIDDFKDTLTNPNGIISSDKVGASIASDIKRNAIIAVILSLLVIFAYIAFRFKGWTWGLGGVVSLAHTSIIIIGFFSLFSGILPFNLDVDQTFIAAILTIIGYAINDNVVIFDRIRENRLLHPNDDFKGSVNKSLNATLTRTVNTSVSTLVTMLAIAIFGGESIRGLSVALILGIIIGTYASIMIGTPVMYDATRKAAAKKK